MKSDPIWLVANWKMHGTRARAADFAYRVNHALSHAPTKINVVFCPPEVMLDAAARSLPQNARLKLGAQDCFYQSQGAFTGCTSALMLHDAQARYVILGHSERRQLCFETNQNVASKAMHAIDSGLIPILCVGESEEAYEAGNTQTMLAEQLAPMTFLPKEYMIAYEPVWAIGSGRTPTAAEIARAHGFIKSTLGSDVSVLYGGSVKPTNLREILQCEGVSGALIGGASLEPESMIAMVAATNEAIHS